MLFSNIRRKLIATPEGDAELIMLPFPAIIPQIGGFIHDADELERKMTDELGKLLFCFKIKKYYSTRKSWRTIF